MIVRNATLFEGSPLRMCCAAAFVVCIAISAQAERIGRVTLDPQTYVSPSGEFSLRVDPSSAAGAGPGTHRLSRNGAMVWTQRPRFTLWRAVVANDGTVAGYAYSGGYENHGRRGKLYIVIMRPDGDVRVVETLERTGESSCTTRISVDVRDLVLDAVNNRFIVRLSWAESLADVAWVFDLQTGDLLGDFPLWAASVALRDGDVALTLSPVPGTPLILINSLFWEVDPDDMSRGGLAYSLVRADGTTVWTLARPFDFPSWLDGPISETSRKARGARMSPQDSRILSEGAILCADAARAFDLWFIKDDVRVTFRVDGSEETGWQVREIGRQDYAYEPRLPETETGGALPPLRVTRRATESTWTKKVGDIPDIQAAQPYAALPADTPHATWRVYQSTDVIHYVADDKAAPRSIRRSFGGDWFVDIAAHSVAPNGALAVSFGKDRDRIALFNPTGDPIMDVKFPSPGRVHYPFQYDGRYLLATSWSTEARELLILDTAVNPPEWRIITGYELLDEMTWRPYLLSGGRELGIVYPDLWKLERYAVEH